MQDINLRLRKVGNSLGIVVPSEIIMRENLRDGDELIITVRNKKNSTVEDMLNEARKQKLKFKKTTEQLLKEIDEDSE